MLLVLILLVLSSTAAAQTTSWSGTSGDWSNPSNWTAGEPTAGSDALVAVASGVQITQAGEICRTLTQAVTVGGSSITIQGGELTVEQEIRLQSVSNGFISQISGQVSAARLRVGETGRGTYTQTGGTLGASSIYIGPEDVGTAGSMTMTSSNPVCTLSDSLVVRSGGSFQCGSGTLTVGQGPGGGAWINGAFTVNNTPSMTLSNLTMQSQGTLSIAVGAQGTAAMMVTGTATLDGQILVLDLGAPDGMYEIIDAGQVQGTFSSAFLPDGWSWSVEGSSVFITKGQVPVERSTWSHIKKNYSN